MTLTEHIDALDKMVADHATTTEIRSQIAFVGREVAALEADYMRLADNHVKLQASQLPVDVPAESFEFKRGLYYKAGDAVPFCPHCREANNMKIHLFGPIEMMNPEIEYWECHTCDKDYSAKPSENFLAKKARPGRRHH